MLDELLKQISDAVEEGEDDRTQPSAVNIIVGNGSTVVIGGNNISQPAGNSDGAQEDGSCRGRGGCGVDRELSQLRHQVCSLKHLINTLCDSVSTSPASCVARRNLSGAHRRTRSNYASRSNRPVPGPRRAATRATAGSVPQSPVRFRNLPHPAPCPIPSVPSQ